MNRLSKCYVMVMCYIDENRMDIAGNIYPLKGFVSAKTFTYDINIQHGLCGILWGRQPYLTYERTTVGDWVVVKTELNNDFIYTDLYRNQVKFRTGMILYSGNVRSAANFIFKNRKERTHHFSPEGKKIQVEEIIGTKEWFKLNRNKGEIKCRI